MNSIEIAQKILNRIELEIQKNKPQKARACIVVKQGGKQKIFWLLPSGLQGASQYQRNIQGDIVNVVTGESRFLNTPGEFVVSKNSAFADAIVDLNGEFREISYQIDNRLVRLAVIANSNYAIKDKLQNFDAYQGFIETEKFDGFKFEKSLRQQIAYEQRLIELNEDVQDDDNLDKIIEIRKQQDEILEKRKNDRKRRRTNTGIREQFLLDASQNKIKKLKLYNGPIIINGGPGTGKTTLLIHRIQYMLDPEINIDYIVKSFSKPEIDFLRNQKTGWIFFSPTNLLKEYLKNAMVAEGLRATNETVKTWEQQRKTITAAFRLYNSETERPFLAYKHEQSLWELSVKDLVEIQKEFDKHLSQYFIDKIKTIEKVSFIKSPWKKEVEEIMFSIKSLIDTFRLDQLIIRLNLLHEKYTGLKNLIEKEYRETLEDIAGRCQKKLSPEEKEWFVNYLKQSRNKTESLSEIEEQEQEQENLINAFEEEEIIEGKRLEVDINKLIKKVIRLDSLKEFDLNTKLSVQEKSILKIIDKYINKDKYEIIGLSSLFIKYLKPILKGSDNYILDEIPRLYKLFRKNVLLTSDLLDVTTKEKLLKIINYTPKNTRIHEDELDFLILQCLKISRQFYVISPKVSMSSSHPILVTFNLNLKGLVAVDEAADFTATQLLCMYHFALPKTNSFTLCGDLMQQTNSRGISNWEDLSKILPGLEINTLYKSYRQTSKLLNLAITLFKSRYNFDPQFRSELPHDLSDPEPLILIEPDFDKRIKWLSRRIVELYNIYEGQIPNIAIFTKNDEQNSKVASALNESESLINYNIEVNSCIKDGDIGSVEKIRVFNIDIIKGLEFEAVIFFDVDNYEDYNKEILDKLIYVGISRATYYLALTLEKEYPERLLPIKNLLLENGTWDSGLESDY